MNPAGYRSPRAVPAGTAAGARHLLLRVLGTEEFFTGADADTGR
ncbi:MAG: hypothetical protein ABW000_14190 [Actinoplanes sp.]